MMLSWTPWLWLAMAGCDGGVLPPTPTNAVDPATAGVSEVPAEPLEGALLLRRVSLDLRGTVPSLAELDAMEDDPSVLPDLIDDFLASERWEQRLVDLFAEQWLTRVDHFNVSEADYHLEADQEFALERSVGEEPLRLMAHVAALDRPWTEIVTADYTLANELLATLWDLDYPAGGTGWQEARYRDDRPAGGVVMTNGLWWRYYTVANNFNRTRAAALSRLLLCEDFLLRPIRFEAQAIISREDLNAATREVDGCIGCHSTLDPLASALFGFWWFDIYDPAEMTIYHAEREGLGAYYLEMEPEWFGIPIDGPAQLGLMLAADDRFQDCTVRRVAQALWRREPLAGDFQALLTLEQAFEEGGGRLNALVRATLAGPDYLAGTLTEQADAADAARVTTRRMMSVDQLEDAMAELTGFTWTHGGFEMLGNDEVGHRILAGGMDGLEVTAPARDPSVTHSLVLKRLAQASADHVVQSELVEDKTAQLLTEVDLTHQPGDPEFTRQLIDLHRRLTGLTPDEDRLALDEALWLDAEALSDPPTAWTTLLSGLLRDPAFWTY